MLTGSSEEKMAKKRVELSPEQLTDMTERTADVLNIVQWLLLEDGLPQSGGALEVGGDQRA
jgi:hypothetical protein